MWPKIGGAYTLSKEKVKEIEQEDSKTGVAIFISHETDTLNRSDLIEPKVKFKILDEFGAETFSHTETNYFPVPVFYKYSIDTLKLNVGGLLPSLDLLLFPSGVEAFYIENHGDDSIFRLGLTDAKSLMLDIPVSVLELRLNTDNFRSTELLYGKLVFETIPYYVDDISFKNNYLKKRIRGSVIFKLGMKKGA